MINYIIQVVLFQVLFLVVYDFFLSKETFFKKNRWYLLGTVLLSFILPFLSFSSLQKGVLKEYTILLPEVILSPEKALEKLSWYQSIDYLDIVFGLGLLVFFVLFLMKLKKIIFLIIRNKPIQKEGFKLVILPKETKAFSFFHFIFLGENISKTQQEKIIQHELVHSKQKHSLDLLLFEFLRIIMWFNPMIYVYQKRITLIHEYLSDDVVVKTTEKEHYINNILSDLFQVESISFVNQFYKHSLIKKRIIMMTKEKSKQVSELKYLMLIPVLASMLLYTACSESKSNSLEPLMSKQKFYTDLDSSPEVVTPFDSYFDMYVNSELPKTKELSISDLNNEEKEEYLKTLDNYNNSLIEIKIFKGMEAKKILVLVYPEKRGKSLGESDVIPFGVIDKTPTFPGCEEGSKDCFKKSMTQFVQDNFNVKLANTLKIKKGKQRIYIKFKINELGKVIDINVRAPHLILKEEAMRMASLLPVMKPGEHKSKKVKVGYVLPITFVIN